MIRHIFLESTPRNLCLVALTLCVAIGRSQDRHQDPSHRRNKLDCARLFAESFGEQCQVPDQQYTAEAKTLCSPDRPGLPDQMAWLIGRGLFDYVAAWRQDPNSPANQTAWKAFRMRCSFGGMLNLPAKGLNAGTRSPDALQRWIAAERFLLEPGRDSTMAALGTKLGRRPLAWAELAVKVYLIRSTYDPKAAPEATEFDLPWQVQANVLKRLSDEIGLPAFVMKDVLKAIEHGQGSDITRAIDALIVTAMTHLHRTTDTAPGKDNDECRSWMLGYSLTRLALHEAANQDVAAFRYEVKAREICLMLRQELPAVNITQKSSRGRLREALKFVGSLPQSELAGIVARHYGPRGSAAFELGLVVPAFLVALSEVDRQKAAARIEGLGQQSGLRKETWEPVAVLLRRGGDADAYALAMTAMEKALEKQLQ